MADLPSQFDPTGKGPFDRLGKFTDFTHFAIYNKDGQLLSNERGVTRQGCRELYKSEPPIGADVIYTYSDDGKTKFEHKIIDGSHAADN